MECQTGHHRGDPAAGTPHRDQAAGFPCIRKPYGMPKRRKVIKSPTENNNAARKMQTGQRESIQAIRMLIKVSFCRPDLFAAMLPAMPEERTWVVLTGSPM